jgi:hypothetical protein
MTMKYLLRQASSPDFETKKVDQAVSQRWKPYAQKKCNH